MFMFILPGHGGIMVRIFHSPRSRGRRFDRSGHQRLIRPGSRTKRFDQSLLRVQGNKVIKENAMFPFIFFLTDSPEDVTIESVISNPADGGTP